MALLREIKLIYKHSDIDDKCQQPLTSPELEYQVFNDLIYETKEKFIAAILDNQHKVMCYEVIALGTVNSCALRPVEVFRSAVILNSPAIVVIHNHPSGMIQLSINDRTITKQLLEVGKTLDIKILVHVIIGNEGFYSFAQEGLL
jgi:DNA repair protein RadC